jgi:hypothetical protein
MARKDGTDTDGAKKAPSRKSSPLATGYDAEFRGYINLELSEDEKAAFGAWFDAGDFWAVFNAQVAAGINYSVKWQSRQETFLASATQRAESSPNAGLVVTARGRDPMTAFGRAVYCVAILDRTERWEDTQPLANPDKW